MKSTNYYNAFIEVSEDYPSKKAKVPVQKNSKKSIALLEFELLFNHPYQYTSDDILFIVYALRQGIKPTDHAKRTEYFSKGRACFRASPLPKQYGWGVHFNEEGKMAIYAKESELYQTFSTDKTITHVKAMRNKRKK